MPTRIRTVVVASALIAILLPWAAAPGGLHAQECLDYGTEPRWLGAPALGPSSALAPAPGGRLAALQGSWLRVFDVADPTRPAPWDDYDLGVSSRCLVVQGDCAYVSRDEYGMLGVRVVIVDPLRGLYGTAVTLGPEPAGEIAASGNLLGVCLADGFSLWDVSDPLAPVRTATVRDGADHRWIALDGTLLATSDATGAARLYDVSDPAAPVLVGGWSGLYGRGAGIVLAGGVAAELIFSYDEGGSWIYGDRWYLRHYALRCLDVTDPAAPVTVETHDLGESHATALAAWQQLACRGGRIVAATDASGRLAVIDPASPAAALSLPLNRTAEATAWADGHLFATLGGGWSGVWSVPPTARVEPLPAPAGGDYFPSILSAEWYRVPRTVADGARVAALCEYGAWDEFGGEYGYQWIDLYDTELDAGSPAGHLETYGSDVALMGPSLLVAAGSLRCVDIADPAAPGPLETVVGITCAEAVEPLDGDLLAVASTSGALQVWDLADRLAPTLVGSCPVQISTYGEVDMIRDGDLLLVASELAESAVTVVDVADPAAPRVRGQFLPGLGRRPLRLDRLAAGRTLVQVGAGTDWVVLIDHTDPDAPRAEAWAQVPWKVLDVQAHAGRIYLLGNGVSELRTEDLAPVGGAASARTILAGVSTGGRLFAVGSTSLVELPVECAVAGVTGDAELPAPRNGLVVRPNPFNPRTTVVFALGQPRAVHLDVYDLRGRHVRGLGAGTWPAGEHEAVWDGRDDAGRALASGTYVLRLEAGPGSAVAKLTLLR